MQITIYLSIILFSFGAYLITANILKVPTAQTTKTIISFYGRDKKIDKINILLDNLASKISKRIYIEEYKRKKLQTTLKTVGINTTPEKHLATIWIKTAIPLVLAIPLALFLPIAILILLVISIRTYFKESRSLEKSMIEEKEKIEYELPRFTREIAQELKSTRDVLLILERYKNNAGRSMKRELNITIADMKSGNYETALSRFETRIGSPMLSDVIRGLISVIRGDDALVFFQLLSHDFKALEIQRLKHQASKRPGQIKKYSFLMLGCMLLMYIVIISISVIKELGGMF